MHRLTLLALLVCLPAIAEQRVAKIGDFKLENGQTIVDCRIGYRTVGTLAKDRSNVVVLTSWFAGNAAQLESWTDRGSLFDRDRYYVIMIDALGDGVSSSPSNSPRQRDAAFPRFTIGDMVRSQHALLTRVLGISHVFAVSGGSMGGMQVLEWVIAYPDFMDRAVALSPTPKMTASDLLLWRTQLDLLESFSDSRADLEKAMRTAAGIQSLELWTPSWIARSWKAEEIDARLAERRASFEKLDPFDYMSQLRAMIAHDVYRHATKRVTAKLLMIVPLQDQMVYPAPALQFARETGAKLVTLAGDCGHLATSCEWEVVKREVRTFLSTE